MSFSKHILTIILFLLFTNLTFSQAEDTNEIKPSLNSGSIESQFNFLYKKSGSYQEYKVVKKTFFHKIKGNVLDSLKSLKNELSNTKQLVDKQNTEISSLKSDLKTTNDNLTEVTKEKDSIKFLGFPMTKSGYNSFLWSVISGLVILLLFFIYKFKNSNTITSQANQSLAETEEEFNSFKTIALEREQKVRRELQDELNKQKSSAKGKKGK